MRNWAKQRRSFSKMLSPLQRGEQVFISNPTGSMVLSHTSLKAFSGRGRIQEYTVIGLCTQGGGRTVKVNDDFHLDDHWSPGRAGIALPSAPAEGFTPAMDMLMIACNLQEFVERMDVIVNIETLKICCQHLVDDDLIRTVMIAMLKDAQVNGLASKFFDQGLLVLLQRFTELAESYHLADSLVGGAEQSPAKRSVNSAIDYIRDHLDEEIRCSELARQSGMDERTFTRAFRRETGKTPFQFLTNQRMLLARLLLKKNMSVTECAMAVGYANPAKFAATFRRQVGVSPSVWRLAANK